MYKIALWGVGEGYNIFTQLHGHDMVEVVALTDKEDRGYKYIDGIPVIRPEELSGYVFDYLVVSVVNEQIYKEIVTEAIMLGIKRESILPLRIFQIAFFNFDDYIRIKESNISILSDYCFAGFLYHKFAMRHTSPTINMFSDNDNYLRFLHNIDAYMKEPMVEIANTVDDSYAGIWTYPRGKVGDVEWQFNHDVSFENALKRWKKGVERFNYDNYIAIMTIRSDAAAYTFDALPIKHKIGFYWKDLHLDSVICLPEWNSPEIRAKHGYNFTNLVNKVADETSGVRAVNWMNALLHKSGFLRVE